MAISSYKSFLMKGTAGSGSTVTYEKLCDVKKIPALGGAPEMLEITTLTDKAKCFIPGIENQENMEFTANYDKTDYASLKALEGSEGYYAVWFGGTESGGTVTPTGSEGKFAFKGKLSVYVNGADVNSVVEMTISIAPTTVIVEES